MPYPPHYVKKLAALNDKYITDPITVLVTELVARVPWITPTAVTLVSFIFALFACFYFLDGNRSSEILGAIMWETNYLLDGVDGKLARKLHLSSRFGAELDATLDKIKKAGALAALVIGELHQTTLLAVVVVVHYLLRFVPCQHDQTIQRWLNNRGLKCTFDPLDHIFLLLFIGPLLGRVVEVAIAVVVLQCCELILHGILAYRRQMFEESLPSHRNS